MAVTFIRTLIIFITLIVVMRLMGKRQIGEMQPFEFVVTLIIADLACVPMSDVSIPLVYGIVGILSLFLMHQLLSLLESTGNFTKFIISGKPSVVIDKNGVNIKELKKNNMSIEDLIESMRSLGYFSLDDLDYAIFESNGKLSTLPNKKNDKIKKGVPLLVINNGKIEKNNLPKLNMNISALDNLIESLHTKVKNIEVLTIDEFGNSYIKEKNQKFYTFKFEFLEATNG